MLERAHQGPLLSEGESMDGSPHHVISDTSFRALNSIQFNSIEFKFICIAILTTLTKQLYRNISIQNINFNLLNLRLSFHCIVLHE